MLTDVVRSATIYPSSSEATIKEHYLGKSVQDLQAPAVIIDVAVARRNCELMLRTTQLLGVKFRAHTVQLARLQVGADSHDIRLVVSTVAEVEGLLPWLEDCRQQGKTVNIVYGLPVVPSAATRLAEVARVLGEHSICLIVDHAQQIKVLEQVQWPHSKVPVLVKVDVGYHRAGVVTGTKQMKQLAMAIHDSTTVHLAGFYAHMGHSYSVSGQEEAPSYLTTEITTLEEGALAFLNITGIDRTPVSRPPYLLTVGATPTATSSQNIMDGHAGSSDCRAVIERVKKTFEVEIHAGVYPLLDMQQLATRARPAHSLKDNSQTMLSFNDLGLRVLVEVASLYDEREYTEALIAAGSIVFGKDACKSYPGFGVVSSWPKKEGQVYDPEGDRIGWIVSSISQEHGILRWQGSKDGRFRSLEVGDKLLVWPNHACMAGPNFGFYFIVDSDQADADKVVDVWSRARGW